MGHGLRYSLVVTVLNADGIVVPQTFDLLGWLVTLMYPDGGVEGFLHSYYGPVAYTNQLTQHTQFA
jgi:hypothetical protein